MSVELCGAELGSGRSHERSSEPPKTKCLQCCVSRDLTRINSMRWRPVVKDTYVDLIKNIN